MIPNDRLRFHFLDVGHGDATIIELPDFGTPVPTPRFAVVDFGDWGTAELVRDYMTELVAARTGDTMDGYSIEFVCVTHPHEDHFAGMRTFLDRFADAGNSALNRVRQFWDCGFRTNSARYNNTLRTIITNRNITFVRLASGIEYEFGQVRVAVLAPSIDLRNRFDTFGVDKNNASIVLRLRLRNSYAVLAGDAEYESWGKIVEEFPRNRSVDYISDALGMAERDETTDQLKSDLLRASHHGSKHGTDLRYLERIDPNRIVISAGDDLWYRNNEPGWIGMFPHPITSLIMGELDAAVSVHVTGETGHVVYSYSGGWCPAQPVFLRSDPGEPGFRQALETALV
jgi:competence protein ComEC